MYRFIPRVCAALEPTALCQQSLGDYFRHQYVGKRGSFGRLIVSCHARKAMLQKLVAQCRPEDLFSACGKIGAYLENVCNFKAAFTL